MQVNLLESPQVYDLIRQFLDQSSRHAQHFERVEQTDLGRQNLDGVIIQYQNFESLTLLASFLLQELKWDFFNGIVYEPEPLQFWALR